LADQINEPLPDNSTGETMTPQPVSGWQKAQTIATCTQVVIVAFSGYFIFNQLRQQKLQLAQQVNLSRAANTQTLTSLITPLNLKLTDRQIAELWVKGFDGIDKVADENERAIQREQYHALVASNMVFYENVYSQYRAGLLDPEIYQGWDRDLADFIQKHKIARYWDEWKRLYRNDFAQRVDEIIQSQTPASQQPAKP
jgi:hypothetical protein